MEARNESFDVVDQFDCWVGSAQLNAQIFLPRDVRAIVTIAYSGQLQGTELYVYDLASKLRQSGLGTVLVDCMPDAYRADDYGSHLERYLPGMLCSRLTGVLARLSNHEELGDYPLGCLGLGTCAAPAIGAAGRYDTFPDAVVTVGGRPSKARELVDEVSVPTLVLRDCARLIEDLLAEKHLPEMFSDRQASVRVPFVEPPFTDAEPFARVSALAENWFLDRLVPSPKPTPDLDTSAVSPSYGLPPSPALMASRYARRRAS